MTYSLHARLCRLEFFLSIFPDLPPEIQAGVVEKMRAVVRRLLEL